MLDMQKVLVVGFGSIGERHARNLHTLGIRHLAVYDSNPERLLSAADDLDVLVFSEYEDALSDFMPDIVFICTPPVFHIDQATLAIESGAHIFIEKPLSNSINGVNELIERVQARKLVAQVGYNLRFHPGLQMVKKLIGANAIGRILWAHVEFGQYLPDWRPWQDYRHSYTVRRDLGGGIILDASHELDYIIWLLGQPVEIKCMAGKVSNLESDVEDCATILIRFESGAQADVHVDFVQRGYERRCKVTGALGTIIWNYPANEISIYKAETGEWGKRTYAFDSNDMYLKEIQHFFDCIMNKKPPLVDLYQAKSVLKMALEAYCEANRGL